jgi:hypothetical protein
LKREKRRESIVLKQFAFSVSVFERLTNWMSKEVRRSNLVSYFEISPAAEHVDPVPCIALVPATAMETTTGNLRDLNLNAADDEEEDEEAHVRLAFPQGLVGSGQAGTKRGGDAGLSVGVGTLNPKTEPNQTESKLPELLVYSGFGFGFGSDNFIIQNSVSVPMV